MDDKPSDTPPFLGSKFGGPMSDEELTPEQRLEKYPYPGVPMDRPVEFDLEVSSDAAPLGHLPPEGKGHRGPSRGYENRYRAIARLIALGHTPRQIARRLGYSDTGISLALQRPFVQAEITRYRQQIFDNDVATALKDMGPDAINVASLMLNGDGEKLKDRFEAAKWVLEKLTGKAKQEINVESNTLAAFMDVVRDMERSGESIDVTSQKVLPAPAGINELTPEPESPVEVDYNAWIEENL